MANWLVTGGAGFIGSHVARELLKFDHHVTIVDDLSSGHRANVPNRARFIESDFSDSKILDDLLPSTDGILHLAAYIDLIKSYQEPDKCREINFSRSQLLLQSAIQHGVRALVFSSSASVYTGTGPSQKVDPQSPYAQSKLDFEAALGEAHAQGKLRCAALRYFNVYGPGQAPSSHYAAVIPKFISQALAGHPLSIYGSGSQRRDFIYVDDVARANRLAAEKLLAQSEPSTPFRSYDLGTSKSVSISELSQLLEQAIGHSLTKLSVARPEGDADDSCASHSSLQNLRSELGWSAKTPLLEGLKETLQWHRARA